MAGNARDKLLTPFLAVIAAFGTYFCMYAFRKPFTAASYADFALAGIAYKTVLVSAQVVGYTVSKFVGIKVIAEMTPQRRAVTLLTLIGIAEIALVGFGMVPAPYNWVFLTLNGLPLGMVFGLVLGFLEGRQLTEALMAGLCASFILADGVVKSVGAWLLTLGVSQFWMPAATGGLFVLPLVTFVWMLTRVPPPSPADVAERAARVPLGRSERWRLFTRYAPGLIAVTLMFLLVTILRSVRADFMPELWRDLGLPAAPSVFTQTEFWVAFGVTAIHGCAALLRNNRAALNLAFAISLAGTCVLGAALVGLQQRTVSPFGFMVLCGLGLYLPYVAVHTTIFERLIAVTQERGNLGFLIYVADSFGYLGYVVVMLAPVLLRKPVNMLATFVTLSWIVTISSICLLTGAWIYFALRARQARAEPILAHAIGPV